jgi:hypothetical protein
MTPNAPKSTRSAEMNAPKTKELAGNHLPPEQTLNSLTLSTEIGHDVV